jgi:hypothetical protein
MGSGFTPVQAATGAPAAFVIHHTGGRGDVAGVENTLHQRGLGVQYVMDRQGNITVAGGPGASNIRRGQGLGAGLSNRNIVGMEIIAKDDSDITPAQVAAAQAFIQAYYPNTPVFGHGQINPHKQYTEGLTVANAIRRARGEAPISSTTKADVAQLQRNLNVQGAGIPVDGIMGPLTRNAMAKYPTTVASAYTSTAPTTTPAQQAANAQAQGRAPTGTISRSGPDVAALQRSLNSMGAGLKVDGLEGPLTRAAAQQFMGSPTSVRTPSFTSAPAQRAAVPQTPAYQNPYSPSTATPQTPAYQNPYTAAPATPRTPYYSNPYSGSTGGANAIVAPRQVPTSSIKGSPLPGVQLPSYGSNIAYPSAIQTGARAVSTTAVPVTGRAPLGNVWGGFDRPAIQTPSIHQPYTMSTGGANAIVQPVQTARIPQPRPIFMPTVVAAPTLQQQLHDKMQRDAAAASQSSRSGAGYSGGGGGYTGGSYGGAGGRSIASGVGGSFKNR